MAIDTAEKRKSVAAMWHTQIPGVTTNAAKNQEWRQKSGWGYSGILASNAAPASASGVIGGGTGLILCAFEG